MAVDPQHYGDSPTYGQPAISEEQWNAMTREEKVEHRQKQIAYALGQIPILAEKQIQQSIEAEQWVARANREPQNVRISLAREIVARAGMPEPVEIPDNAAVRFVYIISQRTGHQISIEVNGTRWVVAAWPGSDRVPEDENGEEA